MSGARAKRGGSGGRSAPGRMSGARAKRGGSGGRSAPGRMAGARSFDRIADIYDETRGGEERGALRELPDPEVDIERVTHPRILVFEQLTSSELRAAGYR